MRTEPDQRGPFLHKIDELIQASLDRPKQLQNFFVTAQRHPEQRTKDRTSSYHHGR